METSGTGHLVDSVLCYIVHVPNIKSKPFTNKLSGCVHLYIKNIKPGTYVCIKSMQMHFVMLLVCFKIVALQFTGENRSFETVVLTQAKTGSSSG